MIPLVAADPIQDTINLQTDLGHGWTLSQLTSLSLARRFSIHNIPRRSISGRFDAVDNLKRVVEDVLAPLSAVFGDGLQIISGYHSPETHEALGIGLTSHVRGRAVDFRIFKTPYGKVLETVRDLRIPFDSIVLKEHHALIHHIPWIHISIPEQGITPRFRVLEYSAGRYRAYRGET